MIREPIVIILGAGSSCEVRMPLGTKLLENISNSLTFQDDAYSSSWQEGSFPWREGSRKLQRLFHTWRDKFPNSDVWRSAAAQIAKGAPLAASIDSFVASRSGDDDLLCVAKCAIYYEILLAERASSLYVSDFRYDQSFENNNDVRNSWFVLLFYKLVEGVLWGNIDKIFENITFVNFNYDRCLEQFFVYALSWYYSVKPEDALIVVKKIKVIRPYGCLGELSLTDGAEGVKFGGEFSEALIKAQYQKIITYSENGTLDGELPEIALALKACKRVIMLGMHFHVANMNMIALRSAKFIDQTPKISGSSPKIFATAVQ